MSAWRLAWRALRREWRAGELATLWLSLTIAVSALTGVGFLVDRITRAVAAQAGEVLAADLRLESHEPLPAAREQLAASLGLARAHVVSMPSAVFAGERNELANVRAVSAGYPLRGRLRVSDRAYGPPMLATDLPGPGEAWPESHLAATLGVTVGGTIEVGARTLRVTRILLSRPDQSATFVDLAPTLLIDERELPATRLVQPGSRLEYALLLAGPPRALAAFRRAVQALGPPPGERLASLADASPQIGEASGRSGQFLALAALVAVLLAAVAVAVGARTYVRRHLDAVALMKTLGATRRTVLATALWQLALLATAATALGAVVGYAVQTWLALVLRGLLRTDLPPAGPWPVAVAALVAYAVLAGLALPPLWQLTAVPALRTLRRDLEPPPPGAWIAALPAVVCLAGIVQVYVGDVALTVRYLGGLALLTAALALVGALLVRLAARVRGGAGAAWRYGIAHLARQRTESLAQIVAFGLAALLLLTLAALRTVLVSDWQRTLPADMPNYFFLNIAPEARESFRTAIAHEGGTLERLLPIVKARLTAINGRAAGEIRGLDERGQRLLEREQNISWSDALGDDNRLTAGRWWGPAGAGRAEASLAEEYRESLHLALGDRLRFDVAGAVYEVTITSFRKVRWDSFRPNFFIMVPPGLMDATAGSYLTSAYLPHATDVAAIAHAFPEVSIFNVGEILATVRSLLDKAVLAVESVFVLTLFAGITVLFAAVQSSHDERWHEAAILRALGASRRLLRMSALVEFALIGAAAGLMAASGAVATAAWIAHRMGLHARVDAWLWVAGVLAATIIVAGAGLLATRRVTRVPPREALSALR